MRGCPSTCNGWMRPLNKHSNHQPLAIMYRLLLLLGAVCLQPVFAENSVAADKAFVVRATVAADAVVVNWRIAADHYLFRDKLRFRSDEPAVSLGEAEIPAGISLDDDFFGVVQVLKGEVQTRIPVLASAGAPAEFTLSISGQGCREGGDCYPAESHELRLSTPIAVLKPSVATDPLAALAGIGDEASGNLAGEEFLDPDDAFVLRAQMGGGGAIEARWTIADGYYLYRDKVSIALDGDSGGVVLGDVNLPSGEIKNDEFFGQVAVLKKAVLATVPLRRLDDEALDLDLSVRYQGCAEAGLCYPPITKKVALALPAAAAPPVAPGDPPAALSEFANSLAGDAAGEDEFLDPEVAFVLTAATEGGQMMARWQIADGYYLYRNKFKFKLLAPTGAALGELQMTKGKVKHDEFFGDVEVYYGQAVAKLSLDGVPGDSADVEVTYQGCADAGLCYPPIKKTFTLGLGGGSSALAQSAPRARPAPISPSAGGSAEVLSEQDAIANMLVTGSLWLTILAFFGFGLALTFTPCVFPMVPILSSIIVGQGEISTRRAFALSAVYVLAMALTYTVAGVIAGMSGANLQILFQDPWILTTFAIVFVVLSLSMFGFYDLQVPPSWQAKLSDISNRQQGGTMIGVAVMGLLSALIVGPCVAAPLAGALIYIGRTGDPLLGGVALFAMSLGMGVPLLAIGLSAGKLMPRAGAWMDIVKAVFGVLMLAVAIWMLERILPGWIGMLLWAALLIVSAIYMGALDTVAQTATGWRRLWKGTGLVMLVYGILIMVGAVSGGRDVFQPLKGIAVASGGQVAHELQFRQIRGLDQLNAALARAGNAGKSTMLDYYADWCISCKELEKYTFSDPAVIAALSDTVLLQTDVTAWDDTDQTLIRKFGLPGPPTIQFFGPDGKERTGYRLVGFKDAEEFLAHIKKLKG